MNGGPPNCYPSSTVDCTPAPAPSSPSPMTATTATTTTPPTTTREVATTTTVAATTTATAVPIIDLTTTAAAEHTAELGKTTEVLTQTEMTTVMSTADKLFLVFPAQSNSGEISCHLNLVYIQLFKCYDTIIKTLNVSPH